MTPGKNTWQRALERSLSQSAGWWTPKHLLIGILFVMAAASIVLMHFSVLPLSGTYLLFYSILVFGASLYRPRYVWTALVVFLPFELIYVGPREIALDVRLYQWAALLLGVATILLWFGKRQGITLPKILWFDGLLFLIGLGAFVAAHDSNSLKQALVVLSFGLLYGLGRIWIQKGSDILRLLPFFWVSSLVVCGYALIQSWQFTHGGTSLAVMTARPNSVLPEADWLGLFAALTGALSWFCLSLGRFKGHFFSQSIAWGGGVIAFMTLLVSVSRSAWLAFFCFAIVFVFETVFTRRKRLIEEGRIVILYVGQVLLAFLIVMGLHLTTFNLSERLASTGGEQMITIACEAPTTLTHVDSVDELASFHCQHINLEDIPKFGESGFAIQEIARPDPNVSVRRQIYAKSWSLIQDHWLRGLGWGEASQFLGSDALGHGLNTSNMFLEVWLGSGLLGILGFGGFWIVAVVVFIKEFFFGQGAVTSARRQSAGILLSLWVLFTAFNLFNAGTLLGIFFGYLVVGGWYLSKVAPTLHKLWQK